MCHLKSRGFLLKISTPTDCISVVTTTEYNFPPAFFFFVHLNVGGTLSSKINKKHFPSFFNNKKKSVQ